MRPLTWLIALIGGTTIGAAHATDFLDESYKALSPKQLDSVVLEVAKVMRDPTSLIFRGLTHPNTGSPVLDNGVVCGFVNGKNIYGAYVGFTPFANQGPINGLDALVTIDAPQADDPDYGNALRKHMMDVSGCAAVLGL
ncbi:hypothetical protein [Mesorhizobium sp. B2-4-1]|uniref:hypothetical protein n=1 Tax=Mesorhizobium sp. B2-4-1 TaxID=2589948 RepID=UPI001127A92D|nr:hypothetical protein [Mesorhizobium sp. B2-4-1]TPL64672.1 hypothetical protein FJ949_15475 [Mesorhizobium sp. B2-4-1]